MKDCKLLSIALSLIIVTSAYAAPIIQGQPENTASYPLAQNNTGQQAPTMQVESSSNDPSDLVNTVTQLQQQVRSLQGQLEVQGHQIDQLTQAQKNIYLQLENKSPATAAIDSAATALTTVTVSTATAPKNNEGVSVKPAATPVTNPKPVAAATAVDTNTTNASASSDSKQKALYDQGYQLITKQQYSEASVAMNDYLTQYPKGDYAANVHYWLGEIGLVSGDLNGAQNHFQAVVTQFSNSPKVSDAQLKLGYIYYQQGKWALARQTLQSLIQQYPNTSAATLATQRLQDMNQQGV